VTRPPSLPTGSPTLRTTLAASGWAAAGAARPAAMERARAERLILNIGSSS
jgi:hypothetical protein